LCHGTVKQTNENASKLSRRERNFFLRVCDKVVVDKISTRDFVNQVDDLTAFGNSL
jgi:hypothetical protein